MSEKTEVEVAFRKKLRMLGGETLASQFDDILDERIQEIDRLIGDSKPKEEVKNRPGPDTAPPIGNGALTKENAPVNEGAPAKEKVEDEPKKANPSTNNSKGGKSKEGPKK